MPTVMPLPFGIEREKALLMRVLEDVKRPDSTSFKHRLRQIARQCCNILISLRPPPASAGPGGVVSEIACFRQLDFDNWISTTGRKRGCA